LGFDDILVTVSEDATCKLWKNTEETKLEKTIINRSLETLKGHSGKNVRALACYEGFIATGGDDGAIKVWNAKEIIASKKSS
jgi:WD40 repeat protein